MLKSKHFIKTLEEIVRKRTLELETDEWRKD